MVDFAKRPEVTVTTMGKVHNPTGEGVRAISAQAQAKAAKCAAKATSKMSSSSSSGGGGGVATAAVTTVSSSSRGATSTTAGARTTSTSTSTSVSTSSSSSSNSSHSIMKQQHHQQIQNHETKIKEGTAKRNIVRKKTADKDSGHYNSNYKKQGGHGKGQWKDDAIRSRYDDDDDDYIMNIDEKDPIYDQAEDTHQYILTSGDVAGQTTTNGGTNNNIKDNNSSCNTTTTTSDSTVVSSKRRGYDPSTSKAVYGPMLTRNEFKVQLMECINEYFDSSDSDEVIRTLIELGCEEYHIDIIKKIISISLDKEPRERELISQLLTCLHPKPLSLQDIEYGFLSLLDSLHDLSMDVPDAETMLSCFLARAVVDEVLPPAFLSEQNNKRPGDPVIEKAVTLLSREHCTARLERIWGPGDGRPVNELKEQMDQLLQEYLLSRELDEAARCVKELKASHFHHELVKRGVFLAMERDGCSQEKVTTTTTSSTSSGQDHGGNNNNNDNHNNQENNDTNDIDIDIDESLLLSNIDAMAALFGFLVNNAIISEYQVNKGIQRLYDRLSDVTLDVPTAPTLLNAFIKMAYERGCLPPPPPPQKQPNATPNNNTPPPAK